MTTLHNLYQAIITPENTLHCPLHSSPLTNLFYETSNLPDVSSSARLVCSECINTPNFDKSHLIKTHFQAYKNPKAYVISLGNFPKLKSSQEKAPVDFQNCQLEHIIVVQDPNDSDKIKVNNGYYPRSLVYIPEKKLLAAGALDGYLYFWSIGTTVEFVRKINIGKSIKFLKYFDIDEKGKCLIIGADSFVHFYDLQDQEPKYMETMTCEAPTNDIAYIPHQKKLITVGRDSLVRFWSLENSSWKGEKVPSSYGIKGPILSVEYIQESHCLVLETDSGLNLLDLDKRELKDTEEVFVDTKRGFSLGYLPKADQLLLFERNSGLNVLNAKDFKLLYEYPGFKPIALAPGLRFVPNEDESQFISNGNGSCAYICDEKTTSRLDMTGLATKTSAIEVLHDQHRFVIGDQHRGTLFIFRTNVQGDKQHKVEKGTDERITIEVEEVQREELSEEEIPKKKEKVPRMKKTSPRKIKISPPALKTKAKTKGKAAKNQEKKPIFSAIRLTRAVANSEKRVLRSADTKNRSEKKELPRKAEKRSLRNTRRSNPKDLAKFTKKPASHQKASKELHEGVSQITLKPVKMKLVLPIVYLGSQDFPIHEENIRKSKISLKVTALPKKIANRKEDDGKMKRVDMKFIVPTRGRRGINKDDDKEESVERSRSKSKSQGKPRRMNTMEETAKEGKELVKKTGYGRGKRSRDKSINYKE